MQLARYRVSFIIVFSLLMWSAGVQAYPQFQFSTDNARCTMCHFSPAGGGLINAWGREEAGDTISRSGDADFLGDAWTPPEWLLLGGDFRGAAIAHDTPAQGIDLLIFPMQADLYSRAEFGSISVITTVGLRRAARTKNPPTLSYLASREHYIMYQPKAQGLYLRAGRFYAPYGLRQVDHTSYIRRDLGFYADEQTYGISGGYLNNNDWEFHLSVFTRDPIFKVGQQGSGAAAFYEKRFADDSAAWGVQSKIQMAPGSQTYWIGSTFKYWFPGSEILVLSETDLGMRTFNSAGAKATFQGIAHLNVTRFLATGLMLGGTLEAKQSDFRLKGKDAESAAVMLQYFPKAHFEFMLLGKAERTRGTHDLSSLLMIHYYL